jgi:hypothetical protein
LKAGKKVKKWQKKTKKRKKSGEKRGKERKIEKKATKRRKKRTGFLITPLPVRGPEDKCRGGFQKEEATEGFLIKY